jgi:hypothetical protein
VEVIRRITLVCPRKRPFNVTASYRRRREIYFVVNEARFQKETTTSGHDE